MSLLLWFRCYLITEGRATWTTLELKISADGCQGLSKVLLHRELAAPWTTNGIMVWARMLWSPYALGTRTELWFGPGCFGHHTRLERERNYGLGMDPLVTVCLWNTNGIITKASLNFRPGQALLICTKGVWGRGNPEKWSNLAVFRGPDPAAGWFWGGLLSRLETGVTGSLFMSGVGVPFRVPWRPFGTPDGRFLGTLEAVLGRAEAVRAPPLHEKMHVLVCTLLESFRPLPVGASGLSLDALVTVCSWNTNGIMVWAWMLWSPYACGTPAEVCFGHGCFGHRMLLEHERKYSWAWMLWSPYALGTRTELWFGQGCSGHCMLVEHERNYGLGLDALVTICPWNTNGIMVWAWMLWSPYALGQFENGGRLHGGARRRGPHQARPLFNCGQTELKLSGRAFIQTRSSIDEVLTFQLIMSALIQPS